MEDDGVGAEILLDLGEGVGDGGGLEGFDVHARAPKGEMDLLRVSPRGGARAGGMPALRGHNSDGFDVDAADDLVVGEDGDGGERGLDELSNMGAGLGGAEDTP